MQITTKTVYLLLGGNMGDREGLIRQAIRLLGERAGEISALSSIYETAAWGVEDQPAFLNIAVKLETLMSPHEVLEQTLKIEEELGRIRAEKWGARLIDIDIILYGNEVVNDAERLRIPHPRMQDRKFVLEPLSEIAGQVEHPVFKQNISGLLSVLKDNLAVKKIK